MDIIKKIEAAKLLGRGGAEFPVAIKWRAVIKAKNENPQKSCYVICNLSEGEPGVKKDIFLVDFHPQELVAGIALAIETLKAKQAYIFVQAHNLKKVKFRLGPYLKKLPITIVSEDKGYLGGEETTLLEIIEGNRAEPRFKPPYPTESGLFGCPTLINNAETFYYIAKISQGEYKNTRLVTISGEVHNPGTFEISTTATIKQILKNTNNLPKFTYFVQIGGGVAGEILLSDELNTPLVGSGSIIIYNREKTDGLKLMKSWINFFSKATCGKCAPCREGLYRLKEELSKNEPNWLMMRAVLETMRDLSFCPLGKSVHEPMMSFLEKVGLK